MMKRRIYLVLYSCAIIALIFYSCKKNHITDPPPVVKNTDSLAAITSFTLPGGEIGDAVITSTADSSKVIVYVKDTLNLTVVKPTITISDKASIVPASGASVDFSGTGNSVEYTVTASNGKKVKWYVQLRRALIYKDPTVTSFFNRTSGIIANDDGNTISLSDGSVLWLMGDTYIDHFDFSTNTIPCLFQVRNTALLQPANDWNWIHAKTLLSPTNSTLYTSTGDFTWPSSGVQLNDTVYVYCSNFKNTGSGSFGFTGIGDMWAKMHFPDMKVVGYHSFQDFKGIGFGISFEKADDGYVYTYGNKQTFIYNNIYIARFKADSPNAAWTFWDGTAWNTDVTKSAVIGQSYSSGVSVARVKDKFVIVSTEFSVGCDQGKKIYMGMSDNRTGPFTPLAQQQVIWTIDDLLNGHYPFFYAPVIHPELINSRNELLITYAINGYGSCVVTCNNNKMDPNVYRLRGIRVPLRLIDPAY